MGLAERRMLAQLRDEVAPKYLAELRKITGTDVTLDIDWDSFADNPAAMGNLELKALKPLNEILRKIARDKMGKDALSEGIKSIRLAHDKDAPSNVSDLRLKGGVLSVLWDWEGWAGSFFPDSVQEKIESML